VPVVVVDRDGPVSLAERGGGTESGCVRREGRG